MTKPNSIKRCSHCKQNKPVESFGKNRAMKDGFQNQCKDCRAKYHQKNRNTLNKKSRLYRGENHKRILAQHRGYHQTVKGAAVKRTAQKRYRQCYPEKYGAHQAVTVAIRKGNIVPASNHLCLACGHLADQYHHYGGYKKANWFDIIPLCTRCHTSYHN